MRNGSHMSALGYPLWGLSFDSAPIKHNQIRLAFHFTPCRIPFQLQIKFQGIESLSHSSGLAACPSSSLLSLSPVTLLNGVNAFPQPQTFALGRRCLTQSADGYMGSTLSPPSLLKFARGRRFLPQSADRFMGATLSPAVHQTLHGVNAFSPNLLICTGATMFPKVC